MKGKTHDLVSRCVDLPVAVDLQEMAVHTVMKKCSATFGQTVVMALVGWVGGQKTWKS